MLFMQCEYIAEKSISKIVGEDIDFSEIRERADEANRRVNFPMEKMLEAYLVNGVTLVDSHLYYYNDSISKYGDFIFHTYDYVDTLKRTISTRFRTEYVDPSIISCYLNYNRNAYEIRVNNFDKIEVNKLVDTVVTDSSAIHSMIKFIVSDTSNEELPSFQIKNIQLLGETWVSKQAFFVYANKVNDSTDVIASWQALQLIYPWILHSYNVVRNKYSEEMFGQKFQFISYEQKLAVTKKYPIRIMFYPYSRHMPPDPPGFL